MTEEEMSRLFAEFSESAEALKKESGSLQEVIAGFEAKLREVGLPIEVWLEERPIQSRELSVSASSVAPTMELQLGYARGSGRPGEEWCLTLRRAEYVQKALTEGSDQRVLARVHQQLRLRDASEEERVAALPLLGALLGRLTIAAREQIEAIRAAKRLVE